MIDIRTELVNLSLGPMPDDYHCSCCFCSKLLGVLRRKDGSLYSKLDRFKYYHKSERGKTGHVAKTPLHLVRYFIQQFTKQDDWVFDPTMGAGTTAVESLNHKRNAAGIEIEFINIIRANVDVNNPFGKKAVLLEGDVRQVHQLIKPHGLQFTLINNNPPYSGDESEHSLGTRPKYNKTYLYNRQYANLAFLREGKTYWQTMARIYWLCSRFLKPGGYFCVGVKDMMRKKKPLLLHYHFAEILEKFLTFQGIVLLPHYPPTLFMNTYPKRWGIPVPRYQTGLIFRKEK